MLIGLTLTLGLEEINESNTWSFEIRASYTANMKITHYFFIAIFKYVILVFFKENLLMEYFLSSEILKMCYLLKKSQFFIVRHHVSNFQAQELLRNRGINFSSSFEFQVAPLTSMLVRALEIP